MKYVIAIFLALSLSGCFWNKETVKIVRVPVPMTPPKIDVPQRPVLGSAELTPATEVDVAVKLMMVDLEFLKSYAQQLENIVKAYQNAADKFIMDKLNTEITVETK